MKLLLMEEICHLVWTFFPWNFFLGEILNGLSLWRTEFNIEMRGIPMVWKVQKFSFKTASHATDILEHMFY